MSTSGVTPWFDVGSLDVGSLDVVFLGLRMYSPWSGEGALTTLTTLSTLLILSVPAFERFNKRRIGSIAAP
jgi:hypothetical protein